jgi:hypothetical protein
VVANDIECLWWKRTVVQFADLIEILVVAPRHRHVVQTYSLVINTVFGAVLWHVDIWVVGKILVKHDGFVKSTTEWESVSNNGPLGFVIEVRMCQHFSQIMYESSEVEPVIFWTRPGLSKGLSSLEEMNDLSLFGIWVRVVH